MFIIKNPKKSGFAKAIGTDRNFGEAYVKADRKQNAFLSDSSGGDGAKINRQNTMHGKLDMPFHSLNKRAGMAKGGIMTGSGRTKKFGEGDLIDSRLDVTENPAAPESSVRSGAKAPEKSFGSAFREARESGAEAFMWRGKKYATDMAKSNIQKGDSRVGSVDDDLSKPSRKPAASAAAEPKEDQQSVAPFRSVRQFLQMGSRKPGFTNNNKKGGAIMKYAKGGGMPMKDGKPAFMKKGDATEMMSRRPRMGAGMPPSAPPVMPPQPPMGMNKGGMPMKDGKPAFMQKKMMGGGMAHGGMHMMPDGKMMKNSAMKKMNMGGMAKYAKGGGIESRGKTQGTIIKMAAGGSVSSRADGIAQRGKTKGKVI